MQGENVWEFFVLWLEMLFNPEVLQEIENIFTYTITFYTFTGAVQINAVSLFTFAGVIALIPIAIAKWIIA